MAQNGPQTIDSDLDIDAIPIEQIDVGQPEIFQNGLAPLYFKRLRREAPIHYCKNGLYGSYWSITRLKDIEAIELDPETFSSDHFNGGISIASSPDEPQYFPSFVAMDPPYHTEKRKVVAPAFSPRRIDTMAIEIRAWCEEILDGLPRGVAFDWVDRVSIELTARTLASLLGYPMESSRDLIRWSEAIVGLVGTPAFPTMADKMNVMNECFDTFDSIWQERLKSPTGDDLLSMLAGQPWAHEFSKEELYGTISLLIVGGNDTTRNSLSGSIVAFDKFPWELKKLRDRPELLSTLTPEVLRWQTPAAHMRRTAMRDVSFGGQKISKGDKVVLWYLSANRDEEVFERADDFILDRLTRAGIFPLGWEYIVASARAWPTCKSEYCGKKH